MYDLFVADGGHLDSFDNWRPGVWFTSSTTKNHPQGFDWGPALGIGLPYGTDKMEKFWVLFTGAHIFVRRDDGDGIWDGWWAYLPQSGTTPPV